MVRPFSVVFEILKSKIGQPGPDARGGGNGRAGTQTQRSLKAKLARHRHP
jgi:hypothetical protein